jgi:hypothetical protein
VTATLDTAIDGSPTSIRRAASWLGSFSTSSAAMSDDVYTQRARSATAWLGDAGDGQRRRLTTLGDTGDSVSGIASRVGRDVEALAAALQSAQALMEHARSVAHAGGLTVSGTLVHPPARHRPPCDRCRPTRPPPTSPPAPATWPR